METPPPAFLEHASKPAPPIKQRSKLLPDGWGGWVFAVVLGLFVLGVFLPVFNTTCVKGAQTKSLAQAKQIGLALRLFAGDHDGNYPRQGVPMEMKEAPQSSNQAFSTLFPTYTQSKAIFGNPLSAYYNDRKTKAKVDPSTAGEAGETLRPGENVYSYMMGFTENSDPKAPLVVDGTDGRGYYHRNRSAWGGTWAGTKAIVVRVDNSAAVENLVGADTGRYIPHQDDARRNLLDGAMWGKNVRLLDPAVVNR